MRALVAVAVIVPDPPSAIEVPFTVRLELANRACANVPELMLVAEIDVTFAPEPLSVPTKLSLVVLPVTARLVNVPTDVILGCAAVVTVPAVVAEVADVADATVPVTLPPGIDVKPAPDPLNCDPVTCPAAEISPPVSKLPEVVLAVTVRLPSVPTLVMLGCALVVTVPAVVAAPVNAPTNVVDVTLDSPATVVTVAPKVNAVLPSVTAALASLAWTSVPELMLLALILVTFAPEPLSVPTKLPAVAFPVTARLPRVPTLVKLELTTVEFRVVPDKLAALAVITVFAAEVICPCELTVNDAT